MDVMDQNPDKSRASAPIVGMIIILLVAFFVGGWLYVDSVKNDLEVRIDAMAVKAKAPQLPTQAPDVVAKAPEPVTPAPAPLKRFIQEIDGVSPAALHFNYPSTWIADRESSVREASTGITEFFDATGTRILSVECSPRVENLGGMMDGAKKSDIDAGGQKFKVFVNPTSNWAIFVENKDPKGNSCLVSFDQKKVSASDYAATVASFGLQTESL